LPFPLETKYISYLFYRAPACNACRLRRYANPLVSPSHFGIVSKGMHISSNSFPSSDRAWI